VRRHFGRPTILLDAVSRDALHSAQVLQLKKPPFETQAKQGSADSALRYISESTAVVSCDP
jgi:hypothetical protein